MRNTLARPRQVELNLGVPFLQRQFEPVAGEHRVPQPQVHDLGELGVTESLQHDAELHDARKHRHAGEVARKERGVGRHGHVETAGGDGFDRKGDHAASINSPMAIWLMLLLGGPVKTEHVESQLVAAHASVRPGTVATVGLRLKLDPAWHVYWRNPGDSGDTVHLDWKLPEGVEAGPIRWPVPHRIPMPGEIMNFGYEGELLLPVRISVPAGFSQTTLRLSAKAEWLVCDENMCLPDIVELELELSVADKPPEPDERWTALFLRAERQHPKAAAAEAFSAYWRDGKVVLRVDMDVRDAHLEFFPSTADQIAHYADQPLSWYGGIYLLELTPEGEPDHLRGVLVINRERGFRVDLDRIHPEAASFPLHLVAAGVLVLGAAVLILRRRRSRPVPAGGQPERDHGASSNGT